MEFTKKRRITEIIAGVVVLALLVFAFISLIGVYQAEDNSTVTTFATSADAKDKGVGITAKLLSIDPVKGDLVVRLQFDPGEEYAGPDGNLTDALTLNVNSATGKTEAAFKKGDRMNPMDVTLSLDGDATEYPFDSHEATLWIYLAKPVKVEQTDGDKTVAETNYEDVPISVDYTGALSGYKIIASEPAEKVEGVCQIDMTVSRSGSVQGFSIFIMIVQWLLAAGALLVTLSVIVRKRKVELAMFSWLAALLFALVPLRNAMAAVPPIGTYSDFLSFFWAEGIVALCLAAIVFTWLFRPNPNK